MRVVALLRGSQGCSCGVSGLLMEAEDVVVLTSANKSEGIVVAEGGGACLDSTGSFDSRHLRDAVREVAAKGILQQWIQHPGLSLAGAGYGGSTQMASGDCSIRRRAVQHCAGPGLEASGRFKPISVGSTSAQPLCVTQCQTAGSGGMTIHWQAGARLRGSLPVLESESSCQCHSDPSQYEYHAASSEMWRALGEAAWQH